MSRTNVVAVVVAYNRQELLRRCLDGLADYVERAAFRETGRPVGSAGSRADDARRP